MGIPTILFLIFLVLKLTDVIDWSWWWVTAPLWIEGLLVFLFVLIYATVGAAAVKVGVGANRLPGARR